MCEIVGAAERLELHQIFGKEKIQSPVQSDAKLFLKTGEFAQINCSSDPPGMNPEKLIPRIFATPVRRPIAASWPMVENENGLRSRPEQSQYDSLPVFFPRAGRAERSEDLSSLAVRHQCAIT
jgi:hypothetical protein